MWNAIRNEFVKWIKIRLWLEMHVNVHVLDAL